ncbi:hypothetical protein [Nocardia cyriacigeorgica]|uniref:hypothetical protein n=1 Tax=Nocardia cyriacigeorgica TaxID=135487 RepID=UPI001E596906|nr:hypothetical protein [Nocardia cyriacigeorgica]
MKRIPATILSVGALALILAGCGPDESTEASGLRKGTTDTSSAATTSARATTTSAESTETSSAPTTTRSGGSTSGTASQTTCAEFRQLDIAGEKALIEAILAEHPESPFAGSPNVALGTAKLVCLSDEMANTPVAEAAGIVEP